jgi:CRP-like cAMP-binding protein
MANSGRASKLNNILACLPEADYQRLAPHLTEVKWSLGDIIYEPYTPIKSVFFPNQSMVSLVRVMADGSTVEAGIVGNDGVLGYPVFLGGESMSSRAMVQIPGSSFALDADVLRYEFDQGGALRQVLLLYTQAFLAQVSQTAACNRFHSIEERLARWLLQSRDFAQSNYLQLTQDFLSTMLGTRRASVTVAARTLQEAGLIQYNRGHISVLNQEGLELATCECYATVRAEYHRLLESFLEQA